MGIFETFTKRLRKTEKSNQDDVYQYDIFPIEFRRQVIHIWTDAIGSYGLIRGRYPSKSNQIWIDIHNMLAREVGEFHLGKSRDNHFLQCQSFLLDSEKDGVLDIIDLSFKMIDVVVRQIPSHLREQAEITQDPDEAISELNHRFQEHGIGYQFLGGELIRVDSQYLHSTVIKPAINLLQQSGFSGPSEEFLKAHEHYRKGDYKESINEANKAFESTLKTICDLKSWTYSPQATAKPLIEIVFQNELIPKFLQNHFNALRTTLESGLPTSRNKTSGHGQGSAPVEVPDYLASYCLHLVATNIVFLVEACNKHS